MNFCFIIKVISSTQGIWEFKIVRVDSGALKTFFKYLPIYIDIGYIHLVVGMFVINIRDLLE